MEQTKKHKYTVTHIEKGMKAARREVEDSELLVKVLNTFIALLEDLNDEHPNSDS